MAKVKTYAVTIRVPVERTYYVEARRPNGAVAKLQTEEGWREATRNEEPDDWTPLRYPEDAEVKSVREAGF